MEKIGKLEDVFNGLKSKPIKSLVVSNGVDSHSIEAVGEAVRRGWIKGILTGNGKLIEKQCLLSGFPSYLFEIIDCTDEDDAARMAVELASKGRADIIMKGLISTDRFMKALLDKTVGLLPKGNLLTHITVMQTPGYNKLLIVSDVAIIPLPTVEQKAIIVQYLISVAHSIGIEKPLVAFIAATEQVISKMPATTDAVLLKQRWLNGDFPDSFCDGPMGLDLALDSEAAKIKNFSSPVAGNADCLLFPNIESGNVFYKANTKLFDASIAAMLVGATVPVVLSSRGDSVETKLNSIALAATVC